MCFFYAKFYGASRAMKFKHWVVWEPMECSWEPLKNRAVCPGPPVRRPVRFWEPMGCSWEVLGSSMESSWEVLGSR